MIDPMTSPVQEVLDWLAERDGWTRNGHCWMRFRDPVNLLDVEECSFHPITLDRLAGMLPEGWRWANIRQRKDDWFVSVVKIGTGAVGCDRPTELEARARVLAAVLMKEVA